MIAPVIPLPVVNGLQPSDIGSSVQAWSAALDTLAASADVLALIAGTETNANFSYCTPTFNGLVTSGPVQMEGSFGIVMVDLPTSDPASAGQLWVDADGFVKASQG